MMALLSTNLYKRFMNTKKTGAYAPIAGSKIPKNTEGDVTCNDIGAISVSGHFNPNVSDRN